MTGGDTTARFWPQSLRTRLIAFLTIALLPLGAIAVVQTVEVTREADRLAERDVLARTVRAASEQGATLERAIGVSGALGTAAAALRDDPETCARIMADFVRSQSDFIFAGFIPPDGWMTCNSAGATINYGGRPEWQDFVESQAPLITVNRNTETIGPAVFIAFTPIFDEDGTTFLGGQAVSIPRGLSETLATSGIDNVDIALVNPAGEVLATNTGIEDDGIFERLGIIPSFMNIPREGRLLRTSDVEGLGQPAAVVPLIPDHIYVVGLWTEGDASQGGGLFGRTVPVFPLLMWLAGLAVAYITVNNLVLRHLSRLSRRMEQFRSDENHQDLSLDPDAPVEFQEIADRYNELVMRVARDQATLEDNIREKDLLLREIHHRVKNNLQLIASILNIQIRGVDDPAAKQVLRRVQDRVMSLSSIHRALYADVNVEHVQVDTLLKDVVSGITDVACSGVSDVEVAVSAAPVRLNPDQAVPFLLLATEAMTNAAKYVGAPDGGARRIDVTLSEGDAGEVVLQVANTRGPDTLGTVAEKREGYGLGGRLITAFASQLGGSVEIEATDHAHDLTLRFHAHPDR